MSLRTIEVAGKTKEEAIAKALEELGLPEDRIEVEVIEEADRGLFGFIGKKECRVKVTELEDNSALIATETFLKSIFEQSDTKCDIQVQRDENGNIKVDVTGDEASIFIGRRGDTLDALQFLTTLVVNNNSEQYQKVMLNIENYREKREESLMSYAKKMARTAVKQRRTVRLDYMNPYERRIVHSVLQSDPYVTTFSEGKEPYRRVVIAQKRKSGDNFQNTNSIEE